jgi:hypothetical protein
MTRTQVAAAAALLLLIATVGSGQARPVLAAPVPGTSCSVFPSNNIWNTDISNLPVNSRSSTWITSTTPSSGKLHPDFGGPPYGIPFNLATNATPTSSFTFQYASESDLGPYPIPPGALIEQGSDAHMLTINSDTCKLYETYATNLGTLTAGSGAIFDLGSNQLRPATWTSADAAGLPIFPGLVRVDEVQAGFIGHAIRFTVHNTNNSFIWPARHQAGISNTTLPPMGARFRLKANYVISGYGAAAQVVLTAFKHYGLIVADNGSDWYFQGTEDAQWNSGAYPQMIQDLKNVPAGAFEAVDESSLMVNANSAQVATAPLRCRRADRRSGSWCCDSHMGATSKWRPTDPELHGDRHSVGLRGGERGRDERCRVRIDERRVVHVHGQRRQCHRHGAAVAALQRGRPESPDHLPERPSPPERPAPGQPAVHRCVAGRPMIAGLSRARPASSLGQAC